MEETVNSLLGEDSVASVLDAPAEIAPKEASWAPLYAGLDQAPADPRQAQTLDLMGKKLGETKETRAQAINLSYVGSKMSGFTPEMLQRNWPNVRTAYAKQAGFTQGEEITDSGLYGHIATSIEEDAEKAKIAHEMATAGSNSERLGVLLHNFSHLFTLNAAQFWGDINKPFVDIPSAPQLPNIPSMGLQNPAVAGGILNLLKPVVEGVETPLGVATLGAGTMLKGAATAGVPLAQKTIATISGLFAGLMAKSAAEATPTALKVLQDPNSTLQEKIEAGGKPVVNGGLAILAGLHAVTELHPEPGPVMKALEGKTPVEAAKELRLEANKTPDSPAVEAMNETAAKLEEIPSDVKPSEAATIPDQAEGGIKTPPEAQNAPQAQGEGKADVPEATPQAVQKAYGIKKTSIDKELKAMGEEPPTKGEVISDKLAMETAAETLRKDPEAGAKLVDELAGENARPVGLDDVVLLGHEWTRLNLERDRLQSELTKANAEGDAAKASEIATQITHNQDDIANTAEVIAQAKGGQGRAFRAIQFMVKDDYTLGAMEQRLKEADPKTPVSPEMTAEVVRLTEALKESERKLSEHSQRVREGGKAKPPAALLTKLSARADAARQRIIDRMQSGQVSAGLDPAMLKDYAEVGAYHIVKGAVDLAHFTEAMVKEFGAKILPHISDIYAKALEHKDAEAHLKAKKTRLVTSQKELERRLAENDLDPKKRTPVKLDEEGMKLEAEVNTLKQELQKRIMQRKLDALSFPEKAATKLAKWRRGFLLSSPSTLIKLTSAALQRMAFTPIEELMGGLFSKIPGVSEVANKAPREGGISPAAEAQAITAAFTKGMSDAAAMMKTGKGVLEAAYSEKAKQVHASDIMPKEAIDFFGHLHGALKAPVKRAEFARSFAKRMEFAIKNGVDGTDPLVQSKIAVEAYKDANRSIFMQDNMVTDAYKRALSRFEQPNKETGKPTPGGLATATALRTLLPIVKVPTNIVAETAQYAAGLPSGAIRLITAAAKGMEKLTPDQADLIMRELKKGSIGGMALLLGYFNPDIFGGYYQPGEKRKETDAKALSMRVGGHDIPSLLLHSPLMETFQVGATIRRVADSKLHKHDQGAQGIGSGAWAAALGLLEEVPFARESVELAKMFDPHERDYAMGELLKSMAVPALVQWIATQTDRDSTGEKIKRKPTTIPQHIETGIPILRSNVPAKRGSGASPRD